METLNLNTERIKAIITIVITAIVNIANIYGYAVDTDSAITIALSALSGITILYSWWKNQNVTKAAVEGQAVINALKEGE